MKKYMYLLLTGIVLAFFSSCNFFSSGGAAGLDEYFIIIEGDTGKTVNISYLHRKKDSKPGNIPNNFYYDDTVSIPFKKCCAYTVHDPDLKHDNPYLSIETDGNTDVTFFIMGDNKKLFTTGDRKKDTLALYNLIPEFRNHHLRNLDLNSPEDSVPPSFQRLYEKYPLDTIIECLQKKNYPFIKTIKAEKSINKKEVEMTGGSTWTWDNN